jgi:hypothetical protein
MRDCGVQGERVATEQHWPASSRQPRGNRGQQAASISQAACAGEGGEVNSFEAAMPLRLAFRLAWRCCGCGFGSVVRRAWVSSVGSPVCRSATLPNTLDLLPLHLPTLPYLPPYLSSLIASISIKASIAAPSVGCQRRCRRLPFPPSPVFGFVWKSTARPHPTLTSTASNVTRSFDR